MSCNILHRAVFFVDISDIKRGIVVIGQHKIDIKDFELIL